MLFLSDLDNTLIYSYKQDIGGSKILVETKEGKALSYMTSMSHGLLDKLKEQLLFVPVTTRSLEQYRRICFFPNWQPEYALVANGGILLQAGKVEPAWYEESQRLIAPAKQQLQAGLRLLEKDGNVCFEVREVDGLFVFTKSNEPEQTIAILQEHLNRELISVHQNGSKVYIFPKVLNKGTAVTRIKSRLNPAETMSAGDSAFDIPMLAEADIAIAPKELVSETIYPKDLIVQTPDTPIFSDGLLAYISGYLCR